MSRAKLSSSLLTRRAALATAASAVHVFKIGGREESGVCDGPSLAVPVSNSDRRSSPSLRWVLTYFGIATVAVTGGALFMHPRERGAVTVGLQAESMMVDTTPLVAAGPREPSPIAETVITIPQRALADSTLTPDPTSQVSMEEAATLLSRGDTALRSGDIATARLYFERAAEAEIPQAALRLGNTYDPAFLAMAGLTGVHGDAAMAQRWYRYAQTLGSTEAGTVLATSVRNDVPSPPIAINTLFEQFLTRTSRK